MSKFYFVFILGIFSTPLMAGSQFSPPGCEYVVEFPDRPKEYNLQKATADGSILPLFGAELSTSKGKALIRAECASAGGNDLSQFTKKAMIGYMEQLALDNGLTRPNFSVENNALGTVGVLTGVKNSERGRMTARIINYIGSSSILTTYIISLSSDFQTKEMLYFSNSVEKIK